jgi:hypothetical protein
LQLTTGYSLIELFGNTSFSFSGESAVNSFVFGLKNRTGQKIIGYTRDQSNTGTRSFTFSQIGLNKISMKACVSHINPTYENINLDNYQVAKWIRVIDRPTYIKFACDYGISTEYFNCDLKIDRITGSRLNLTVQTDSSYNLTSMTLAGNLYIFFIKCLIYS